MKQLSMEKLKSDLRLFVGICNVRKAKSLSNDHTYWSGRVDAYLDIYYLISDDDSVRLPFRIDSKENIALVKKTWTKVILK